MEIARERFLDDSRRLHLSLSLRSRTTEMHSLLTELSRDERDAVGVAIATALDAIGALVSQKLDAVGSARPRTDPTPAPSE